MSLNWGKGMCRRVLKESSCIERGLKFRIREKCEVVSQDYISTTSSVDNKNGTVLRKEEETIALERKKESI